MHNIQLLCALLFVVLCALCCHQVMVVGPRHRAWGIERFGVTPCKVSDSAVAQLSFMLLTALLIQCWQAKLTCMHLVPGSSASTLGVDEF